MPIRFVRRNVKYVTSNYDGLYERKHSCPISIPSEDQTNISFDLSKSDLTDEQKATLTTFLEENKDLFSPSLKTLGKTDLYHCVIETEPGKGPAQMPFYRQPPHIRTEIYRQIDEML